MFSGDCRLLEWTGKYGVSMECRVHGEREEMAGVDAFGGEEGDV